MPKIFCSQCKHLNSHCGILDCMAPSEVKSNWYAENATGVSPARKNRHNDCPDYEPALRVLMEQKYQKLINNS